MGTVVDVAVETVRGLRAHAFRFALAASGVFWGVAMLTYLSAAADSYDRHFARELDKVGQRIVFLFPGRVSKATVGQRDSRLLELERPDVARLATLDVVERAAPNAWLGPHVLRAAGRTKVVWLYGASEDTCAVRNFAVADGRFLSRGDVDRAARTLFLGVRAAERLFGRATAVGHAVHVDGVPFTVVGVSVPKGEQLLFVGPPDDEVGFVPISTAQHWFTRSRVVDQVVFAPRSRAESWQALDRVRGLVALRHRIRADDTSALGAFNVQEAVDLVEGLLLALRLFLMVASVVTLVVGAVGVTNVMLVMVGERTRELGLLKALGASGRALFVQVLAETLALTAGAGLAGAAFAALAVRASAAAAAPSSPLGATPPELGWGIVVRVVVVLVAVGTVAGLVPARRAARIDPAVALRTTGA